MLGHNILCYENNSGNFRVGSGGAQSQWEGNLQQRVRIGFGGTSSCTEGLLDAVEMNYTETCCCACFHLLQTQQILTQSHSAVCYPWTIKTMQRAEPSHSQRCSQITPHRLKTCRSFPGCYKLLIYLISHVAQMLVNVTTQKTSVANCPNKFIPRRKRKVNLISELHERHSVWVAASMQNPSMDSIVHTCSKSQQTHWTPARAWQRQSGWWFLTHNRQSVDTLWNQY